MKPDFDKYPDKLVPAIIQDFTTAKILMLGYMNEEAYECTKADGKVTFYSRSKQRLWQKGKSSGNYLLLRSIILDCDADCLLLKVNPTGPVCHNGTESCFDDDMSQGPFLPQLEQIIKQRKDEPIAGSYVSQLFKKGINKIAQKVGEEAVELVIEAKDNDPDLFKNEAADLLFHYLILLQAKGTCLADVENVLQARHRK